MRRWVRQRGRAPAAANVEATATVPQSWQRDRFRFFMFGLTSERGAGMTSPISESIERERGTEEAPALAGFRENGPRISAASRRAPLSMASARQSPRAMAGRFLPYSSACLGRMENGGVYCESVLSHDHASPLDGTCGELSTSRGEGRWQAKSWRNLLHARPRRKLRSARRRGPLSEPAPAPPTRRQS